MSARFGLCLAVFVLGLVLCASAAASGSEPPDLDELFFVSQNHHPDLGRPTARGPGCNAVSVFRLGDATPLFQLSLATLGLEPEGTSWVRGLAGTTDFRLVLANRGRTFVAHDPPALVLRLLAQGNGWTRWSAPPPLVGANFGVDIGLAIMPNNDTLLVEHRGESVTKPEEFGLAKYCLSEVGPDGRLGPRRGFAATMGPDLQIFPSADGIHAHVIDGTYRTISSLDVRTMERYLPDMRIYHLSQTHDQTACQEFIGTISADERYLVYAHERYGGQDALGVADLIERRLWHVALNGLCACADCCTPALSHGPANRGLLAIRGVQEVVVFAFKPPTGLRKLSRWPLSSFDWPCHSPLAWSGDGSHLLVGEAVAGEPDILALRVSDGGRSLTPVRRFSSCQTREGLNIPQHLLTANRKLPFRDIPCLPPTATPTATLRPTITGTATSTPQPSPSPSTTPTLRPSASPTATLIPSPSPTASLTPTPTATATPQPVPLYLPLVLREECPTTKQHVDVVLVIDASTSMRDQRTSAGRTKLAAAIEAARTFVGLVSLPADQVGVVVFNRDAQLLQGLTGRRAEVEAALERIGHLVRQQTRIDLGIELAHQELTSPRHRPQNQPVLILLTDGLANPVPASVAVEKAERAKGDGITLFTIGLGQPGELDMAELRAMATRPEYFYWAPDGEQLLGIYRTIAVELPCPGAHFWGQG